MKKLIAAAAAAAMVLVAVPTVARSAGGAEGCRLDKAMVWQAKTDDGYYVDTRVTTDPAELRGLIDHWEEMAAQLYWNPNREGLYLGWVAEAEALLANNLVCPTPTPTPTVTVTATPTPAPTVTVTATPTPTAKAKAAKTCTKKAVKKKKKKK